jgi:phenylacetate-coenzyme A ligase PaaK-like adenylate-forming protein
MPGEARTALDLWRAQRQGVAGLTRRQESRLAELLASTRTRSRLYRRLYQGVPAEGVHLRDLPPVTKPALMADFDDWVTDPGLTRDGLEAFVADPTMLGVPYRGGYFVCTSSGTCGHPGLFVYDREAITVLRAMVITRIDLGWLTTAELMHVAARGFRWAAVVGTGSHFAGAGWVELERRRSRWRARAFRLFSVQRPLADLAAALQAFDPAILTGYPSALRLLAEEQAAGRLRLRPVLVETAGETTSADARTGMAEAFVCTVHDVYAASECQWLAFGCSAGWLHVNSDWVILEPVDEALRPTPAGEPSHTVLVTNLANHVQPIIRYDLGDSVIARDAPCPCGNPLPAIRVAGRCDDVLHLTGSDGSAVTVLPLAITAVVEETLAVRRSQLIQTGPDTIRLRLETKPDADVDRTWLEVTTKLHGYLVAQGLGNVSVVRAGEPPEQTATSGKFHQVIA